MTQLAKIIDVTQTFVPVDPQAFPETMHGTMREDAPAKAPEAAAYEGYNFLPTPYGYKSFFGTNSHVAIDAIGSRVDRLFVVQKNTFENFLVALCEDGIWTKSAASNGAWTHEVTMTVPNAGVHNNWTYAIISDTLYVYRQGESSYQVIGPDPVLNTVQPANVITNLSLPVNGFASTTLPAGTYSVQVAAYLADGSLSAPCAAVQITLANPGSFDSLWDKYATATKYRVYLTTNNVTYYADVAQNTDATMTKVGFTFSKLPANTVTLPDTTVPSYTYAPYAVHSVVPNFLNMTGQMGIFKAGGRLGFWDSADSVAWSNLDDFSDFTPSIQTLAGSATFEDVHGRIVIIRPCGEGFIIYATNSIVYVAQNVEATFQWNPTVVMSNAGISYPQECVAAVPDTTHFAYTNIGLFKIENAKAGVIVPEVTDYLKDSKDPIFLKLLEGRYLALQMLDPKYIDGMVEFTVNNIPPSTYTFPTDLKDTQELIDGVTLSPQDLCGNYGLIGSGFTADQQADAEAARVAAGAPEKKAGTYYKPIWTGYFSQDLGDPDNITWGPGPCPTVDPNGVEANMCPVGTVGTLNPPKLALTGDQLYADGALTIERFIAIQTAIWEAGDKNRAKFIQNVTNRAKSVTKSTTVNVCNPVNLTRQDCTMGRYIAETSPPVFGYSKCTFRMTRFITKAFDLVRVKTNQTFCDQQTRDVYYVNGDANHPYKEDASLAALGQYVCRAYYGPPNTNLDFDFVSSAGGAPQVYCKGLWYGFYNAGLNSGVVVGHGITNYVQRDVMNAYNKPVFVDMIGKDEGYMTITGWKYTDKNGVDHTIASQACQMPATAPDNPPAPNSVNGKDAPNVVGSFDGSVCGLPYEPVTIPAISANPIQWPTQSVTVPGSTFLLQNGSIGPIYPTFAGALVYDLYLKKWGKLKLQYKQLLDYSPVNTNAGDTISNSTFGINAGALLADGLIYLFDDKPSDSYIKWGKIGYYRLGMTTCEEINIHFRNPSTGMVEVQTSLDGRNPEAMFNRAQSYDSVNKVNVTPSTAGKWHSITIRGNYDVQYMEYRGVVSGRR